MSTAWVVRQVRPPLVFKAALYLVEDGIVSESNISVSPFFAFYFCALALPLFSVFSVSTSLYYGLHLCFRIRTRALSALVELYCTNVTPHLAAFLDGAHDHCTA